MTAALLTAEASRELDRQAIASGISGEALMERAGANVADIICKKYAPRPALILCGSGNNGGDGFVIARLLKERGWPVTVATPSPGGTFNPQLLNNAQLIVDALFGTGLNKPLAGEFPALIDAVNAAHLPCFAVDIPSGINADTGEVMGAAIRATHTVTFTTAKPGHVLLPGKTYTGDLHITDIGIPTNMLEQYLLSAPSPQPSPSRGEGVTGRHYLNRPTLWQDALPAPTPESHKYTRGHAVICGGGIATTGAARLAAMAAARAGAGLTSVICDRESLPVYAASLLSVMTRPAENHHEFLHIISDERVSALLIGPGAGVGEQTAQRVLSILEAGTPCVLDADALTVFADQPETLLNALHEACVITPHEGEFGRIFVSSLQEEYQCKLHRVLAATERCKAVVVLKGSDTIIAQHGRATVINDNAPPWLATAGSGDILAGIITGLMAQGMPAFDAACAGVWLHGRAGEAGKGLIAEDLLER